MKNEKVNKIVIAALILVTITMISAGCIDKDKEEMEEIKTVVVYVNTQDVAFNQYGALGAAFDLKADKKIENVIVFYGPGGIEMTKKGSLAKYKLTPAIKEVIAGQYDSLTADVLPDNLELLARFLHTELGVDFYCCGSFNAVMENVTDIDKVEDVEDFITPLKIPDAVGAGLNADRTIFL